MSGLRIAPAAVYELAAPLDRLVGTPENLRLPALEWGLLLAVTGRHTVARIGEHLGLADAERDRGFGHLLELGLIAERPLTLGEYVRAAATVSGETRTLAEFLSGGLRGLAAPDDPGISPSEPAAPTPETTPLDPFEPLTLPEEDISMPAMPAIHAPSARPSLSLQAVMRFISAQAPGRDAGQLDVYRAFVRVQPQLLKRNGITTLRFEDDRLVNDPDLQSAILASVEHVVGKPCPPDVFVRG